MKRIKNLLLATAMFAVVGGALAFKAKVFSGKIYTTNDPQGELCPTLVNGFTIVGSGTYRATSSAPDTQHPDGYPCANVKTVVFD